MNKKNLYFGVGLLFMSILLICAYLSPLSIIIKGLIIPVGMTAWIFMILSLSIFHNHKKLDNKAQSGLLACIAFIAFLIFIFWLLGNFSSDLVQVDVEGNLDSIKFYPQDVELIIYVDGIEYAKTFTIQNDFEEYKDWLRKWIDYKVDFYIYEGNNYPYDLHVHDVKNVTVKQVIYKEDSFWSKPPMRAIFSDGSSFTFTGNSDHKFNMYAKFIAFNHEYVSIDYSFDCYDDIRIHNIERIMEVK